MGMCLNTCFNCHYTYLDYDTDKKPIYKCCYKCDDRFKVDSGGTYSQRKSCRYHNFDNNNVCRDCHEHKEQKNRNASLGLYCFLRSKLF